MSKALPPPIDTDKIHGFKSPNLADAVKIAFTPASLGIEIIGNFLNSGREGRTILMDPNGQLSRGHSAPRSCVAHRPADRNSAIEGTRPR